MSLPELSLALADAYWATDFGCTREELRPKNTLVRVHGPGLEDFSAIYAIVLDGAAPLVSIPVELHARVAPRAARWTTATLRDESALRAELRDVNIERVIGPAFVGYAPQLAMPAPPNARRLEQEEWPLVHELAEACTAFDWEHGGTSDRHVPVFGAFTNDGRMVALAHYEVWAATIAHLRVVTHPAFRGRGFGPGAVLAAAEAALAEGLLPQYRTLESNGPSMKVAQRLGFSHYGFIVAVYAT